MILYYTILNSLQCIQRNALLYYCILRNAILYYTILLQYNTTVYDADADIDTAIQHLFDFHCFISPAPSLITVQ